MADSGDTSGHEESSPEMSRGSGEEGGSQQDSGGEQRSEEEVYTLLFCEVDSDGSGLVTVDSLVDYLRRMQLGTPRSIGRGRGAGVEEVYDSQEDVHQVQYNLQLLKAMLEVSAMDGQVDQSTYSHVIRLWVKDVRDRSSQQATSSLEVSQLSDSEEDDGGVAVTTPKPVLSFVAEESFETSGGNSSTHSALDRLDMLTSLQDVRLDNRRLAERERQLQVSLDVSEEQLRALQAKNSSLQKELHSAQQQLVRLEAVDRENTAIEQSLKEEGLKCEGLTEAAEKMSQQLREAQRELAVLRERMNEREAEREQGQEEAIELGQQLLAKEEALCRARQQCAALQAQLSTIVATDQSLRLKVTELEESNALLQSENVDLHSAAISSGPAYSTPSRSAGLPSLHEELSRHGNLSGQAMPSPLVGVDSHHHGNKSESCRLEDHYDNTDPSLSRSPGNLSMEDLEHMAQNSSNKFHSKTEAMVRLLTELINSSRSLPPRSSSTPHSSRSCESITGVKHQKDGNMRQLVACVKKLYSEKKQLKQQVTELQAQLEQQAREEVDAAVQTTPPLVTPTVTEAPTREPEAVKEVATQTLAPSLRAPHSMAPSSTSPSCLSMCTHMAARVLRSVVWVLLALVLLLLLLAVLVWLHEQLHPPRCGGCPLTPGAMIWALLQPHVSVTHHGLI